MRFFVFSRVSDLVGENVFLASPFQPQPKQTRGLGVVIQEVIYKPNTLLLPAQNLTCPQKEHEIKEKSYEVS